MSYYHAKWGFMNVGIVSARNKADARRVAAKQWGTGDPKDFNVVNVTAKEAGQIRRMKAGTRNPRRVQRITHR